MKNSLLIGLGLASTLAFTSCSQENKEHSSTETKTEAVVAEAKTEEMAPTTIKLEEIEGQFTTTELNLEAGKKYNFEVKNNGIEKEVAFVLAPKPAEGASTEEIMATAIGDAMLTQYVNNGETASSKAPVSLEAGEYIYFCPLNSTPQYSLTVK